MRRPKPSLRSQVRAFTLVELLVVIGIIALLIAILMPALTRARESSITLACLSNQRQLSMMLQMYASENRQSMPYATECTDGSGAGSGICSAGHPYRAHTTFREYVLERGGKDVRRCPGGSFSRHWNGITHKLEAGSWWGGAGPEIEADAWITVNARLCPRDDHWQQNKGFFGTPDEYRVASKISKFRTPQLIMATCDAYVPSQNQAPYGVVTDENNDNIGNFGYPPERLRFRHGRQQTSINLSFLDGHAETWEFKTLKQPPAINDAYPRNIFTEDMRYLPWGWEKAN